MFRKLRVMHYDSPTKACVHMGMLLILSEPQLSLKNGTVTGVYTYIHTLTRFLQSSPRKRCPEDDSKSQYHSTEFGKDNKGLKILPKFLSLGDWLNGVATHSLTEGL